MKNLGAEFRRHPHHCNVRGSETLPREVRWKFGMPPVNNANFAWIQHFIHHLSLVGVKNSIDFESLLFTHIRNPNLNLV